MLRNKEIRLFVCCFVLITVVSTAAGSAIHRAAGVLALGIAVAFGTAFYLFTRERYRSIARISEQIDLVLHNTEHLYISEMREGELSILESEIMKMTLRIREQNAALLREKEHLAESLADVAHQLRTPLTSVNLILSLLENNPQEAERKELLRETEQLLVQMDWLITSLLKISRLDAGIVVFQMAEIDLESLITVSLRPFLISMELHHITVDTKVPEGVTIFGDMEWLSEAIRNILKNCMENAGDDGTIAIRGIDTLLYTEITIHDSGAGFEEEDLYHVFDRFYRGKGSSDTGYGIGLALCRKIIVRHGGTVTAKNHRYGGAVFTLRFSKRQIFEPKEIRNCM